MTKILNGSRQFGKPVKKSSTEISESANKNSLLLLAQAITSATAAISTQSSRFTTRGHIHKSGRAVAEATSWDVLRQTAQHFRQGLASNLHFRQFNGSKNTNRMQGGDAKSLGFD